MQFWGRVGRVWKTWKQHSWLKEQAAAAKYIKIQSNVPGQGIEDEVQGEKETKSEVYNPGCEWSLSL